MIKNKTVSTGDGHRQRLRTRFVQSGLDGFLDYEIIELLLTLGTPRKDCKQAAKNLVSKFGNLKKVLDASNDELQQVKGVGPVNSIGIQLFKALSKRYAKENVKIKSLLDSPQKVAEYVRKKYGQEKKEYFLIKMIYYNWI
jgi:DNA repair protein RadC